MKKGLLLVICLAMMVASISAIQMKPGITPKELPYDGQSRVVSQTRNAPSYVFTQNPIVVSRNYYDYMIGSYSGLPLQRKQNGDGYFMVYHGLATSDAVYRRVYFAAIDANGVISDQGEITRTAKNEGYPAMAVDPVDGKPFFAWHGNSDSDPDLEVEYTSDSYFEGIIGNFNEIGVVIDNPWAITDPNPPGEGIGDTEDNVFVWPQMAIGPSPNAGMRRLYISARNSTNHLIWTGDDPVPSENIILAYTDFDTDMIEFGDILEWNYTTIPTQDAWHHADNGFFRRPNNSLVADELGNVYMVGHHNAYIMDDEGNSQVYIEPNADVFICPNYGEGEWIYHSADSQIFFDNPDDYFEHESEPLPEGHLYWGISNTGHYNAVLSNDGKLLFPTTMCVNIIEGFYYPAFHYPKVVALDPTNGAIEIRDIYPRKHPMDDVNEIFTPWDIEEPFGEPEWHYDEESGEYYFDLELLWPFPHYNSDLHDGSMMFHNNKMKLSEPNEDGLMVAVWQESLRAKRYNENSWDHYAEYQNTPEVWISVSSDSGENWSDPIVLNNVETPELNNMKPMWVYPANEVITTGTLPNGDKVGKIGFMFFDDFTWGAQAVSPPAHSQKDGGNVMFMELQINFSTTSNANETAPAVVNMLNQNYPNPFNPQTTVTFDMPAAADAKLEVYNVRGQKVKTLHNGFAHNGRNSVVWNGDDDNGNSVSSGVYFYRLSNEFGKQTRKMMLMK